jgi:hypothetical protein
MSAIVIETLEALDARLKQLHFSIGQQEIVCASFGTKIEGASARRLLFLYRCERDEAIARRQWLLDYIERTSTLEDERGKGH